jgi:hypothetical protein
MKNLALLLVVSVSSVGQNYKVEQTSEHGIPIVRLVDTVDGVEVSILRLESCIRNESALEKYLEKPEGVRPILLRVWESQPGRQTVPGDGVRPARRGFHCSCSS